MTQPFLIYLKCSLFSQLCLMMHIFGDIVLLMIWNVWKISGIIFVLFNVITILLSNIHVFIFNRLNFLLIIFSPSGIFRWGTHLYMSLFPFGRSFVRLFVRLFVRPCTFSPKQNWIHQTSASANLWHQCCGLFCLFVSWPASPNMDLNKRQCDLGRPDISQVARTMWKKVKVVGVGFICTYIAYLTLRTSTSTNMISSVCLSICPNCFCCSQVPRTILKKAKVVGVGFICKN